tara:strand:+ start:368 stop:1171 length:804 start_codon:yes stop_codon:yes gene_type:complete
MKKKNLKLNDINIAYLDNEANAEIAVVFIHGNSLSSESFKNQFKDDELNNYRLLALDLPGHGNSGHLPHYSIPLFVNTIANFCKTIALKKFVIVGHSLGGHFTIQSLPRLTDCLGAFICSTPPVTSPLNLKSAFLTHPIMPLLFKKDLNDADMDLFAESLSNNEHGAFLKKSLKTTHNKVREQLMASIQNGDMADEVEILEQLTIPIALLCGREDLFVNTDYIESLSIPSLWKNKLILIEEASHCPHLEHPEVFNTALVSFITFCSK